MLSLGVAGASPARAQVRAGGAAPQSSAADIAAAGDPTPADELVLRVLLNGSEVSAGAILVRLGGDQGLAADAADLSAWRIVLPRGAGPLETGGSRGTHPPGDGPRQGAGLAEAGRRPVPLAAIDGLMAVLDEASLTLQLTAEPRALTTFEIASDAAAARPSASAGLGAFLDYDILYTRGGDAPDMLGGLTEIGGFSPLGVGLSSFLLQDLTRAPEVIRLESSLVRDLPDRRAALRLGDGVVAGGSLAPPFRFGGIEFATNFATDPAFVTFPMPLIGGLAEEAATIDVLVDNLTQFSSRVPAGPFRLDTPPVVTGAGEVQLRVTDLLGRERVITQPFYISTRLLRAGLHDFAYAAGAVRQSYGEAGFDYGEVFASGTHRYGLTDALTLEAHADAALDYQSLAAGGTFLLGNYGVLSGGLGLARDIDAGLGWLGQIGYDYQGRWFDVGASTRYRSAGAGGLGQLARPGRSDRLNLGFSLSTFGRLSLLFVNDDMDGEVSRAVLGTYSVAAGPGSFVLNLGQTLAPGRELGVLLAYSMPLGQTQSISTSASWQDGRRGLESRWRKSRGGAETGWDMGLGADIGDDPSRFAASLGYQADVTAARLDFDRFENTNNLRANLQGSLLATAGKAAATRRLGPAFGVVDAGLPDLRVYLENREVGRTGSDGRLVLPQLQPYQANRVRIEVDDLPLDAVIEAPEAVAVPFSRSGVRVAFAIQRDTRAIALLADATGRPLPRGLVLRSADGTVEARTGLEGFTEVRGLGSEPVTVEGVTQGVSVACTLPAPPAGEVLADLGPVRCS